MKVVLSERAIDWLKQAPQNVRRSFYKQLRFLTNNLQHPSLHTKKYDESANLWQARVLVTGASISRLQATHTGSRT